MKTVPIPLVSLNVCYLYKNEELSDGVLKLRVEKEGFKKLRKDDSLDKK